MTDFGIWLPNGLAERSVKLSSLPHLQEMMNSDPAVRAALERYLDGRETLEEALSEAVYALYQVKEKMRDTPSGQPEQRQMIDDQRGIFADVVRKRRKELGMRLEILAGRTSQSIDYSATCLSQKEPAGSAERDQLVRYGMALPYPT